MPDTTHTPQALEARLARTYDHPSYDDPYDAVEDYRRVQRAAANHPNKGSQALSTVVGLPRSRIRSWVDGDGMPDAARAVSVAQNKGWLDPSGDTAVGLAAMTGHVLGGGSITEENYVPSVCEGRRVTTSDIDRAFREVGVQSDIRHEASENRATEVIPAEHASILGRTLAAWGVPVGEARPAELPVLLESVDTSSREAFLKAYIRHRGTNLPEKATTTCRAAYPRGFQSAFAEAVSEATGERASAGSDAVTVSAAAMRNLGLVEK